MRSNPNWNKLWNRLRETYRLSGKHRYVAVLDNFIDSKEIICRKLGVICELDVNRINNKFEKQHKM